MQAQRHDSSFPHDVIPTSCTWLALPSEFSVHMHIAATWDYTQGKQLQCLPGWWVPLWKAKWPHPCFGVDQVQKWLDRTILKNCLPSATDILLWYLHKSLSGFAHKEQPQEVCFLITESLEHLCCFREVGAIMGKKPGQERNSWKRKEELYGMGHLHWHGLLLLLFFFFLQCRCQ